MPEGRRYALESLFGPGRPEMVGYVPHARILGISVVEIGPGYSVCKLPFRDEIIGNPRLPAVHGGVIGAFLELTALLRMIDESGTDRVPKPITFSVDYLRSAGPTTTRARAEIFKLGRRIATVHAVAWQEDPSKPVAAGNGKVLL